MSKKKTKQKQTIEQSNNKNKKQKGHYPPNLQFRIALTTKTHTLLYLSFVEALKPVYIPSNINM